MVSFNHLLRGYAGILLVATIAIAALYLGSYRGGSPLLYALLIGMALNPLVVDNQVAKYGIEFAARSLLRLGVALLGVRITFDQVMALGWSTALLMIAAVITTILCGMFAAKHLGLSKRLGLLTGGATAICGASAAMAIASVLPNDKQSEGELTFTIAGITLFSTTAAILYPLIGDMFHLDTQHMGIFLGGAIHDVAQVVGAGYSVSPKVGDTAVLTKLMRVMMLLPVVMIISFVIQHRLTTPLEASEQSYKNLFPPFLLGFIGLVMLTSFNILSHSTISILDHISRICLVVAVAAVGLKTSPQAIKNVGLRALILMGIESLFLLGMVLGAEKLMQLYPL